MKKNSNKTVCSTQYMNNNELKKQKSLNTQGDELNDEQVGTN